MRFILPTFVKQKHHYFWATIICVLAATFYLYEFILQVSPQVITDQLMRDFGIHSAGLGFLAACYFYAYMPMQFPAGLLYDRFGPRILLTIMVAVCAVGALLFSRGDHLTIVAFGRALMGFGSAFAFIGTLVLVSRWFPASFFPVITGIVQSMSSVGSSGRKGTDFLVPEKPSRAKYPCNWGQEVAAGVQRRQARSLS